MSSESNFNLKPRLERTLLVAAEPQNQPSIFCGLVYHDLTSRSTRINWTLNFLKVAAFQIL